MNAIHFQKKKISARGVQKRTPTFCDAPNLQQREWSLYFATNRGPERYLSSISLGH